MGSDLDTHARLERGLGLALCLAVLLGAAGVVGIGRRIDATLELLGSHRGPGAPAYSGPASSPRAGRRGAAPRLVVLVTLDGLRADRLVELSSLAGFAEDATRFETVCAQASVPSRSLQSMLTGLYPLALLQDRTGADLSVLRSQEAPDRFLEERLATARASLVLAFERAGYATGLFGETGALPDGLLTSFSVHDEDVPLREGVAHATRWLDASDGPHLVLLHGSLLADADLEPERRPTAYAEALARVDDTLADLLGGLSLRGRLADCLLAVTGTHGANLGERAGPAYGGLYPEQLLVPLWLRLPTSWPRAPLTEDEAVELVDVLPTLLDACAVPAPRGLDGRTLLPILLRGVRGRSLLVAQTSRGDSGANPVLRSVLAPGRWQLLHDARDDSAEFFSLASDPDALVPTRPRPGEVPGFVEAFFTRDAHAPAAAAALSSSEATH